ncbi:hypothetical protein [Actinomadura sp. 7K507]|uniref:hypothetical protein n=1 Tax=Actinomadura sp. 7K507 TaxID=2530365 RepID=UPI0010481D26|nr:hypothetical protein [Actinomadura sp. 7K507]TDC74854.1 hypothetical protein E1285_42445 [Actinomadura sp. 7K507]
MWQVNSSRAVVLRNTVTDADGDRANLTFEAWTADANGNPIAQVNLTDANPYGVLVSDYVASGATASVTVPSGFLEPAKNYIFRTSAYDGTLYETTWSPWAKFKILHTVDITLPEPDPNQPALNQDEFQGQQRIDAPEISDVTPPSPQSGTPNHGENEECDYRKVNEKTGAKACMRILPTDNKKFQKALDRIKANSESPDVVDWCANVAISEIKRHEGCVNLGLGVRYTYQGPNGVPITIDIEWFVQQQIKLANNSGLINEKITAVPADILELGELESVSLDVQHRCAGVCTIGAVDSNLRWTWTPGAQHIAETETTYTWGRANVADATDFLELSPIAIPSIKLPATPPTQVLPHKTWKAADADIRCDTVVQTTAGCVFSEYTPTWTFNSRKTPAAVAHAWLIKTMLPNHPGSKTHNSPMYYLPPVNRADNPGRDPDANRAVICPGGWARDHGHPDTTSLTEISSNDVPSCDEFAFASSYNSGGMPAANGGLNPVSSGDQCLQTYATRKTQGEWHLYSDEREQAPTFTELCGRSSMSNWMNGTSMGGAFSSGFSRKYRLMDHDPYWVSTPGFDHCDSTTRPVRCTMSMPS